MDVPFAEKVSSVVKLEENSRDVEIEILNIIKDENSQNRKIGRKKISELLCKKNIFMSEQEVRKKLLELKDKNLVDVTKGRGGTRITDEGIKHLMS